MYKHNTNNACKNKVGFVFVDFHDRITAEKAYEALKTVNFGLYYKPIAVEFAKPNPNRKINSYG
jgi:U11/U12 small nuclear ribonucleoprotein SNRNP65